MPPDDFDPRLALDGGRPIFPAGAPPWPPADPAVRIALLAAFDNGDWGRYTGRCSAELVERLGNWVGVEHVQLCSSGTIAVELALRGVAVGPGDEVILAGYDFPGNFRAIEAVGARPVLVDLADGGWTLDPAALDAAASERTRAVIVSHLHGSLAPMRRIVAAARARGWSVIEDACQCPGAVVDGRPAGAGGDVGVWSFGGSKLLTAGRGGALFTANEDIAQRMTIARERGNDAFPLSQLQAAVLPPQLDLLAERNVRRAASVQRLAAHLATYAGVRLATPPTGDDRPAYYKLGLFCDALPDGRPVDRTRLAAALQAEGVAIDVGFRGFARRPASRCRRVGELLHSRRAAAATLVLHHPVLLAAEEVVDRLAAAFHKVLAAL